MADKCQEHPGRAAVFEYNGVHYCKQCQVGYQTAVRGVSAHVVPKDCFVVYAGADQWKPLSGTGCAHWVSHQKNIQQGSSSGRCLKGYNFRVHDLAAYLRTHQSEIGDLKNVQVGDIWVAGNEGHCGIVCQLKPETNTDKPDPRKTIVIEHDSSGQGRVARNELSWLITSGGHGPGQGRFYRVAGLS